MISQKNFDSLQDKRKISIFEFIRKYTRFYKKKPAELQNLSNFTSSFYRISVYLKLLTAHIIKSCYQE
jgi:hypothetical protein